MKREGMKFGSLFAGVGGFDLGFEAAGMECCFQVEWDAHCQQVLAHHWPDVPRWSDVSDVKGADLPPVDVITFGSPCQDLSTAGKRAGLEGGRSGLFFEATRIIKEMRDATNGSFPRVAVWENVPGAFSSNEGHDFGSVLDGLANVGAVGIEWAVLDARWFGVPQRRRRIFVVAEFDPARASRNGEPILAVGKGSARDLEKSLKQRASVTGETVGSIKNGGITGTLNVSDLQKGQTNNQSLDENFLQVVETFAFQPGSMIPQGAGLHNEVVPTLRSEAHNGDNSPHVLIVDQSRSDAFVIGSFADYKKDETVGAIRAKGGDLGGGSEALVVIDATRLANIRIYDDETTPCLKSRMGTGGGQVPLMAIPIQGTVIGRQDHNGPGRGWGDDGSAMYTLTQMDTHFVATNYEVRKLTEVECERLMGWPDNHTLYRADGKKTSSTQRYKMCGNGVAAPVAKWVAEQIIASEPT
jgi:DNA (cytosine-5)-methyltransferase 1